MKLLSNFKSEYTNTTNFKSYEQGRKKHKLRSKNVNNKNLESLNNSKPNNPASINNTKTNNPASKLLTGGASKRVKYEGKTYNVGEARPSNVGNKKWEREVTWEENGKLRKKKVSYGYRGMKDYTQHKDEDRRRRFRARASGIKDKTGKLTKDNPLSGNYYNLKDTW